MSSELLRSDLAAGLQPDAVQAYLRARGWEDDGPEGPGARAYVKHGAGTGAEVLVPTRPTAPDYGQVTSLLIERLAKIEGVSREVILRDLALAGYDVLRVRVLDADDGSVDLERGIAVFQQARAALVAAANAAAAKAPRRNYAGRQHESVGAFLERVKLGQTERGSYVVPLLTPYAFDVLNTTLLPGEWFGRRVMRKLTTSLTAVDKALSAADLQSGQSFVDAAPQGVSANLCLALGRLVEAAGKVELSVRWASAEPEPSEAPPLRLVEQTAPALLRAAAHLAEADPPPAEPIVGFVTKLVGDDAVVETWLDGRLRNVRLSIEERHRETFADAWQDRRRIYLDGKLEREGKRLNLTDVTTALVMGGEDADD